MDNMQLTGYRSDLPVTLVDLHKFVLVGTEKLALVKAEIRSIEKLELANDVRMQKLEEARIISKVLLDAEIRIGELLQKLPKGSGGRRKTGVVEVLLPTPKTKNEMIRELGFSKTTAHTFETLAKHKDLVEKIVSEAGENGQLLTRKEVLKRVKNKNWRNPKNQVQTITAENRYWKFCEDTYFSFSKPLFGMQKLNLDDARLKAMSDFYYKNPISIGRDQKRLDEVSTKLTKLQDFLKDLAEQNHLQ